MIKQDKTVSIRTSTAIVGAVITALTVTAVILGGLLWSSTNERTARDARAADDTRARQVAIDYAVGASNINYQDVSPWLTKLKANTSPQLGTKFDATAPKLQELLVPLKWTSNGTPIDATVASEAAGIYKVNVFLTVTSTSAQTPQSAQTTVVYNVTVDKNSQWHVTDVGGMDGALPTR
ncbi:hypothetical protein AB0M22_20960 [Nocardia sp. NPDC051756]|uniref:hypothetical protein n=1 Tax=Nocardia sp. NPDC051756 TaxID=3154751 RepID=UPI003422174B